MNVVQKIFRMLFVLFLTAFLIGGALIVAVQTVGVVALSESIVIGAKDVIAPWAFISATLCAVCAFVLRYSTSHKPGDEAGHELD